MTSAAMGSGPRNDSSVSFSLSCKPNEAECNWGDLLRSSNRHVRGKALHAAFPSKPAFFVAAERARGIELVVGVGPNDAGAKFVGELENLAAFIRPNTSAQTIRDVVGAFESFFRRAESHDT